MPVVTMIGGPNGSGKSTLIRLLLDQGADLGEHLNADDIARDMAGSGDVVAREAQAIVRQRRQAALDAGVDFSWETVMSHTSHIEFLAAALERGYEVRLVYVATSNPLGNIERVRERVENGGHDVPADRIVSRYHRSLANLSAAIVVSHRARIFDNSSVYSPMRLVAAYECGRLTRHDLSPDWFLPAFHDLASYDQR